MQKTKKRRIPLIFKLLLPLMAGVILAFYTSFFPGVLWLMFVLVMLLVSSSFLSGFYKLRLVFPILTTVFFFLLGGYLAGIQTHRYHASYFYSNENSYSDLYQVEVVDQPEVKANSIKCFVDVKAVNGEKCMGKTLLYVEKTDRALDLKYGDVLCLQSNFTEVKPNGNPKEFDYSRYLRIHNVVHQSFVQDQNWAKVGSEGSAFFSWIFNIRQSLDDVLTESGLNASNLMVARALILGKKESLDRETLRTFSSAGAMHVLAVSGLHVGIVMLLFSFVLKPIKRLPKGKLWFLISVVAGIWFYALITGMSSSVLRASVMFSFVIVGKELERETSIYQSIMVSAFLLILIEPLVIFQVGFQLSYLAVLGIVFLQPKIYNLVYFKYWLPDKIWQISSVSLAAQFATFPLGLYYFHQFPNFFMVSNLIVIPLAFAILLAGMVYFITFWIPGLDYCFYKVLEFLLTILNKGVKWVEDLPHSIYWGVSIHWFEVFWLYLILVMITGAFIWRKSKLVLAALLSITALLLFNIAEKNYLASKNSLVIYNVNKSVAVDLFYGNKNVFIADNSLIKDEDKLLFHVRHNWFYRTGKESPELTIPYSSETEIVEFGGQTLLFLEGTDTGHVPLTDYVYLHNIQFVDSELVTRWKEKSVRVIIGSNVGYKARNYLEKNLRSGFVHNLKKDGALIVDF